MRYNGLFEPDVLIGELAGANHRRATTLSSEKRLMLAVLRSALECYQNHLHAKDAQSREMFEEAAAWLASTSSAGLFTFHGIAEALDIEPDGLRRRLADWTRRRRDGEGAGEPA
jgi:hypothetical protein